MQITSPQPSHPDTAIDALFMTRRRPRLSLRKHLRTSLLPVAALGAVTLCGVLLPLDGVAARLVVVGLAALWLALVAANVDLHRYGLWLLIPALICLAAGSWAAVTLGLGVAALPVAAGATLVGLAAVRAVGRLSWLLPLGLVATISDIHSVYWGRTAQFLANGSGSAQLGDTVSKSELYEEPLRVLVLNLPSGADQVWLLGSIDLCACALLLGAAAHLRLGVWRTALALAMALAVALAAPSAVPVLPLLLIAVAAVHWRAFAAATRYALRRSLFSYAG